MARPFEPNSNSSYMKADIFQRKMARHDGRNSNLEFIPSESIDPVAIFEVLEEWEHQLTHSDFNKIKEPSKPEPATKEPKP